MTDVAALIAVVVAAAVVLYAQGQKLQREQAEQERDVFRMLNEGNKTSEAERP